MGDWPLDTLNALQFATEGSNTVSVPLVTTTATGAPCVCQPKLPPGWIVILSSTVAPGFTVRVIGVAIVPTARAWAKIGGPAATADPAATSVASATAATNVILILGLLRVVVHRICRHEATRPPFACSLRWRSSQVGIGGSRWSTAVGSADDSLP
jgi:hypothetical protein